jgi:hypothetical protein
LGLIEPQGINGGPIAPDLRYPMIASRDICEVAAHGFDSVSGMASSSGSFLGERDLTFVEATRIIGERTGKRSAIRSFPICTSCIALPDGDFPERGCALRGDGARGEKGRVKP